MSFIERFGLSIPLIQAPMAGVSTPSLAAQVCETGGLGSIAIGASDPHTARTMIDETRQRTARPFNVNLFAHREPERDAAREAAWLEFLRPVFAEFDAEPPRALRTIYKSFCVDAEMLGMLLDVKPAVVSFHFGLPPEDAIVALRQAGVYLMATATSPAEARAVEAAGIDAVVAQGIEAGGHRGVFDPDAPDAALGTMALTRLLARQGKLPVIAAGAIMDGAGMAAVLKLGAAAAQLGTAFVTCPESAADAAYRKALLGPGAAHTHLTTLVSGRPARTLPTRFSALSERPGAHRPPDYPIAYDAGKALNAAAKAKGEHGFSAQWAGEGAPLCRVLPAAELVAALKREFECAMGPFS